MKDIIEGKITEIKCLDHGFVKLIDCMPRLIPDVEETVDFAIAEAARCSYKRGTKTVNDDKSLIRYLMRHDHTSPFEMIEFKFHIKLPIFVARQIIRHRTASVSEMSGRYSEMPKEYYIPDNDNIRKQSIVNKQGSEGYVDEHTANLFINGVDETSKICFDFYDFALKDKVTREQSRIILPLNTFTEWYWKIDLKNLLHFLSLRCDLKAQQEVKIYSDAILNLIKPIVSYTIEAWEDYSSYRGGINLTKYEFNVLKEYLREVEKLKIISNATSLKIRDIDVENKLEKKEWEQKLKNFLGK